MSGREFILLLEKRSVVYFNRILCCIASFFEIESHFRRYSYFILKMSANRARDDEILIVTDSRYLFTYFSGIPDARLINRFRKLP